MNVWVLTRSSCNEDVATYEEAPDLYLSKFDAYSDKDREASELAAELKKEFPNQDVSLHPGDTRSTVTRKDKLAGAVLERHIWTVWELEL